MHYQQGLFSRMPGLSLLLILGIILSSTSLIHAQAEAPSNSKVLRGPVSKIAKISIEPVNQEPGGECDLLVVDAYPVDFMQGSVSIIFHVEIANEGESPSPPTILLIRDESQQASGTTTVDGINPGESRGTEVQIEGPDSWWNTTRSFIIELDPDETAPESNRRNNNFVIRGIEVPPEPEPEPGSGPDPEPRPDEDDNTLILILVVGIVGVVGIAVLGGSGLLIRSSVKANERRQWEKQAKQGHPPDDCQPSQRYCEVENEIEMKAMHITHLELTAADPASGQERRKQTIKGQLPADLQSIILAHWMGESTDKLVPRIEVLAQSLSKTLSEFLQRDQATYNLDVIVHLEGIELTSTFTLYQCTGSPPNTSWKRLATWNVTKQQERDDPVVAVSGINGTESSLAVRIPTELFPQLRDYIERY
ncbi:MAG: hypothetical protein JXB30_04515 [Anaerolineae bacterium]|nr:hypothetical protein [Anaerolineae bacterium]